MLKLLTPVLALAFTLTLTSVAQANQVGVAQLSRGEVIATGTTGQTRQINRRSAVFEGDRLRTGRASVVVMRFNDGTRMALRPNTEFEVQKYDDSAGKESAFMRLVRGGFRAISGFLSKRRPNSVRIRMGSVATIGIRGTTVSGRICGTDCQQEAAAAGQGDAPGPGEALVGVEDGNVDVTTQQIGPDDPFSPEASIAPGGGLTIGTDGAFRPGLISAVLTNDPNLALDDAGGPAPQAAAEDEGSPFDSPLFNTPGVPGGQFQTTPTQQEIQGIQKEVNSET